MILFKSKTLNETVAAVSFVAYLIAPFVGSAWISLPVAVALMVVTLAVIRVVRGSHKGN